MPNEANKTVLFCLIPMFLAIYAASYYFSIYIDKIIQKINIKIPKNKENKKHFILFFVFFTVYALIGFIWLAAFYPGGFSADSINQYTQATTGNYNDWHPALHTLLFFNLPLAIFKTPQSIVACQIILFSAAVAYTTTTIYSIAKRKWGIVFFLVIVTNPIVFDELMFPWKDVGFAIVSLLTATIILKNYWEHIILKQQTTHVFFIIILASLLTLATLFRHNGFLFSLPALLSLFFFLSKKQWSILLAIFLSMLFMIKVPLYSILNVQSPDKRTVETVGFPLTILGNIAKYAPQSMDEKTANYMYEIAPANIWEEDYYTGDFNSVKFSKIDKNAIEKLNPIQINLLATKNAIKTPIVSSLAAFKLTHVVYGVGDIESYAVVPEIQPNNKAGIIKNGNSFLANAINSYRSLHRQSIIKYTSFCGFTILLIIAFILFKNSRNDWKKILLCTPVLFYDFGTMLLLSGPETRFFYINFLLYPVILLLASLPTNKQKTKHQKNKRVNNTHLSLL